MNATVRDVMTPDPVGVYYEQTIGEAARIMRDSGVGAVLVVRGSSLDGVVTDRDLVVRALAGGAGPEVPVGPLSSQRLVGVEAAQPVAEAGRLMGENAVRRLPVIEGGQIVGMVSLGDLAVTGHEGSSLAAVSQAPSNL